MKISNRIQAAIRPLRTIPCTSLFFSYSPSLFSNTWDVTIDVPELPQPSLVRGTISLNHIVLDGQMALVARIHLSPDLNIDAVRTASIASMHIQQERLAAESAWLPIRLYVDRSMRELATWTQTLRQEFTEFDVNWHLWSGAGTITMVPRP